MYETTDINKQSRNDIEMGNEKSKASGPRSPSGGGSGGSGPSASSQARAAIQNLTKQPNSAKNVQEHLERAKKSGVLQLAKCNLKEVPPQLAQMLTLRNLDLSENKIEVIPSLIGEYKNLKQLHLNQNRIQMLPDEVGNLKKCEVISLHHNRLVSIPSTFVGMMALKTVRLDHNQLLSFPLCMCDLPYLETLDISSNRLEALDGPPERYAKLQCIELNLCQNQLRSLNDGLANCPRLITLRLQENCLQLEALSPAILAESKLSLIEVEGNLFQDKDFHHTPGYDEYLEKFTENKKKMF